MVLSAFDDSIMAAFELFCENGNCLSDVNNTIGENIDQEAAVGAILADSDVKELVNATLNDVSGLGIDVEKAQELINAEDEQQVASIVSETINQISESLSEEGWLSGLLGSFFEGSRNQGMERRGSRDGFRRRL